MKLLWVVEMKIGDNWKPVVKVGVGLNRADARDEKKCWDYENPTDTFRVVKYACIGG